MFPKKKKNPFVVCISVNEAYAVLSKEEVVKTITILQITKNMNILCTKAKMFEFLCKLSYKCPLEIP